MDVIMVEDAANRTQWHLCHELRYPRCMCIKKRYVNHRAVCYHPMSALDIMMSAVERRSTTRDVEEHGHALIFFCHIVHMTYKHTLLKEKHDLHIYLGSVDDDVRHDCAEVEPARSHVDSSDGLVSPPALTPKIAKHCRVRMPLPNRT